MANAITRAWRSIFASNTAPVIAERALPQLPSGAPVGLVPAKAAPGNETHPFVNATVGGIHRVLLQAFTGDLGQLMDLYDDMRDRDARVDAVCRTRLLALQARPWSVTPPEGFEDDPEALRVAERCKLLISRVRAASTPDPRMDGGWKTALGFISDGILRGLSVSELEWGVSREGWHYPARVHFRHSNRFRFQPDMTLVRWDVSGKPTALEELGRDRFVVHTPTAGRAGYPTRRGVLLGAIWPSLTKRFGLRWWLKATEKWGAPQPVITLPSGSEGLRDEAIAMARALSENWAGVLWGGVQMDALKGSGDLKPEVYDKLVREYANVEIAIQVLGQNLTTEVQGGSFAAAGVQNLVRQDLQIGDLAELDDTITWQILEPMVRYNWPGAPVPRYRTEVDARAPFARDDVDRGLATPDEYRSSLGWGPMPDGRGAEFRTPSTSVATALPGAPLALPAGSTGSSTDNDSDPAASEEERQDDPFGVSRQVPAQTPAPSLSTLSTSPTSAPPPTPRAHALYRALVELARTK